MKKGGLFLSFYQVFESLVVGEPSEYSSFELFSSCAVEADGFAKGFVEGVLIDVVRFDVLKGSAVGNTTAETGHFTEKSLHELANGHARRDGVVVEEEVVDGPVCGPGHVFLGHDDAAKSLLGVHAGELVAHLRSALCRGLYAGGLEIVFGQIDHDALDHGSFVVLDHGAAIAPVLCLFLFFLAAVRNGLRGLADQHVILVDEGSWGDDAIFAVHFRVVRMTPSECEVMVPKAVLVRAMSRLVVTHGTPARVSKHATFDARSV